MIRTASNSTRKHVARRFWRVPCAVGVMALSALLAQGCDHKKPVAPVLPSTAAPVSLIAGTATVGSTLDTPVRIVVTGDDGKPLPGTVVQWEASNGGKVSARESSTDAVGIAQVRWTLGPTAGLQSLTGSVVGLPPVIFGANATPDRAAIVRVSSDLVRITLLGDTVHVSATSVTDQYGNTVSTPATLSLESGGAIVTNGAAPNPVFIARARGTSVIKAVADTATTRVTVLVDPATPSISRVSPDTLIPGENVVVEGSGFALVADAVDLSIGGVRATVTKVTASRIEAFVPSSYGCQPTGPTAVTVTIATASGQFAAPLRTANRVTLAKGQSVSLMDPDLVRCTELVQPTGNATAKYLVAVLNTSVTPSLTVGYELRGAGGGVLAGTIARPVSFAATAMGLPSAPPRDATLLPTRLAADIAAARRSAEQHTAILSRQRAIQARFGSPVSAWRAQRAAASTGARTARASASRVPRSFGDTVLMKALYNSCTTGRDVRARVVYAGVSALLLEDVASPRAGTMDDQYRLIGEEFDRVQYPLLQSQVADPLAMNDAMNGDSRISVLFTRFVNDSLAGVSGYSSACNFYPKSVFAASNEDEVIYARVASLAESPEEWRRSMRSTVVHEGKHLASFALRFAEGTPFEDIWLEESLGRVAEELYSRTFDNGGSWKGHIGYDVPLRCEIYQCDDRPLTMWKHFSVLYQYMRGVDTLTPLGASASGDFTFYASGWALVRWALDQYAADESAAIKALVRGGQFTGLNNLSSLTGRPAIEMLADWSLANAVSGLPGFVPQRSQLRLPTWDMANVFAGLATAFPATFVADPLRPRAMTFGSFALTVARLRGFSSSYFSFEGQQTGSQLLELRGEGGVVLPPPGLRMAIVRVE